MNTPTPREVFEKWITTDLNYSVATYRNSEEYLSDAVQVAWIAWQEASKELTAAREELLKSCMRERLAHEDYKYQKERADDAGFMLIEVTEQRDRLAEALETKRIRLAVCGVVAMADTKKTRTKAREMLPEYRSASLSDVERRVDECIKLREQRDRLIWLLGQVLQDMPQRRDWLNPDYEREIKQALQSLNHV